VNLSTLKTSNMRRAKRYRKGRGPGSGNGKLAGRGQNGYYSRTGNSRKRNFEGGQMTIWRRLPKRGFSNFRYSKDFACVNVGELGVFEDGATVGWLELSAAGLIPAPLACRGLAGIKILGDGELQKKLTVQAHRFTKGALARLEAAGCTVEQIEGRFPAPQDDAATEASH
jgi:large subunit ribosomal protein L15